MLHIRDVISVNPEILGGEPVFKGTRVPIDTLMSHLEKGITIDEFLDDFPGVSRDQVTSLLEIANKILTSSNIMKLYESAA